jgi:phenylpropionate dioxygenase-like ring-hydroxylating dioxygenase large terminal subunit
MRFPFPAYPNGWFAAAFSPELPPGQVLTRKIFGRELVLYRTTDAVHAVDAHCPHLGAHLGHGGRVVADKLRCPFHGWCFDKSGTCVEIPGAEKIPPRAQLGTWPAVEKNGVIFIHHHAENAQPAWQVPMLDDDGWTANKTVVWKLRTHPQEIMENTVDCAHLVPIHGVDRGSLARQPVDDGPMFNVLVELVADGAIVGMPGLTNQVFLDVTLHGLGHTVVQSEVRTANIRARQRIYCTPIDEEHTEVRGVVNVRRLPDEAVSEQIAELFYRAFVVDFAMDLPVWENKIYREKPMLSSADGPFMHYRKWARQFYSA